MNMNLKKKNCFLIVASSNCLYLKEMSILYIQARSNSLCAFDFRCRHTACSLLEHAFWESVKRVQYARSFFSLSLSSFLGVIFSQTQHRKKMIGKKKVRNKIVITRMSLIFLSCRHC
jgi:hypothetical protein